jgi:hypothetical protein
MLILNGSTETALASECVNWQCIEIMHPAYYGLAE